MAPGGANVRLPLAHLAYGLLASLALAAALLLEPGWAAYGLPGSTSTLVLTHLFTLGWVTATTMGAMLMIVPVAGVATVPAGPFALLVPLGTLPGVILMLLGFGLGENALLAVGGSLVVLGVLAFYYLLARTVQGVTVPSPTPGGALIAASFLVLTVLFGLTEALNLSYGFWQVSLIRFLALHADLGGFGWISLAILAVSYKLIAMFTLSHEHERYPRAVFALWSLAVLWGAVMALWGTDALAALGALPALAAYVLFLLDMRRLLGARQRPIEPGIRQAILSWVVLGVLLLAVPLQLLGLFAISPYAYAWLFVFGFAGANLWGFLFKVAPFLVWFHSYAELAPGQKAPKLTEMVGPVYLRYGSWLLYLAVPLGAFGLAIPYRPFLTAGEIFALLAAAMFLAAGWRLGRHYLGRVPAA